MRTNRTRFMAMQLGIGSAPVKKPDPTDFIQHLQYADVDKPAYDRHMTKQESHRSIVSLLGEATKDPETFDAFMETWNTLFEQGQLEQVHSFADVEAAALTSMASAANDAAHSAVGRKVGGLLENFDGAVYLVRENGKILTQNTEAFNAYGLGTGGSLDDLPLDLSDGTEISDSIRKSLAPGRNRYDAVLKPAYGKSGRAPFTLSITPSKPIKDSTGEALVFVVDARWKTSAAGLIKREFDLTDAERALLEAFLDGQTTQDMAKNRERSHATIRTQFHSLMTKMGVSSQTELFRNALSISQFVDKIGEIAEVLRHPHRKRVDIVRPGGRSVEVTLMGDFSGKPIVFIQNAANYTFERHIEKAFYDAGLCILSVCRPGCGDTVSEPDGASMSDTFAEDIIALLDQAGHQTCLVMSSNLSARLMYGISKQIETRCHGLVQIAALVPAPYLAQQDWPMAWAKALHRALQKSSGLANFMVHAGSTAWVKMGTPAFLKLQLDSGSPVLMRLLQDESKTELQTALEITTKQGTGRLTEDVANQFKDFSEDIAATKLPILVVHGTEDHIFPIHAVRSFVDSDPARMTLLEIPEIGFGPLDTHATEIVAELCSFYARTLN